MVQIVGSPQELLCQPEMLSVLEKWPGLFGEQCGDAVEGTGTNRASVVTIAMSTKSDRRIFLAFITVSFSDTGGNRRARFLSISA